MNARIYSGLLALCPADLRREFGVEMIQVFLDDLEDHRLRFGFHGVVRVWQRSLKDLSAVALREAMAQELFAVPLIVYGFELFYAGMIFLVCQEPLPPLPAILSGFAIPPMVAFVAARVVNRDLPVSLGLERR